MCLRGRARLEVGGQKERVPGSTVVCRGGGACGKVLSCTESGSESKGGREGAPGHLAVRTQGSWARLSASGQSRMDGQAACRTGLGHPLGSLPCLGPAGSHSRNYPRHSPYDSDKDGSSQRAATHDLDVENCGWVRAWALAVLTGRGSSSAVLIGGGTQAQLLQVETHFIAGGLLSTPKFCQAKLLPQAALPAEGSQALLKTVRQLQWEYRKALRLAHHMSRAVSILLMDLLISHSPRHTEDKGNKLLFIGKRKGHSNAFWRAPMAFALKPSRSLT